jgi:hypothetical protein
MVGHPTGGSLDVRFVLALGADAGDAQEFVELRQMGVATTFYKFSKVHKGLSGAASPFGKIITALKSNECGGKPNARG